MKFERSLAFARNLDRKDPLRTFRSKFHLPKVNGKPAIYFTGNSLGLQPKKAARYIDEELKEWAHSAVDGHLTGKRPWLYYHHFYKKSLARLAGALPSEVVAMSQLTVNLHLMLTSFYRPTPDRFKIIAEAGAFSSDQYAIESHIRLHGLDLSESLVEITPRRGESYVLTDDIIEQISQHGSQLALVIFGGVQYYSGQRFDLSAITRAGHAAGAYVGFDLAHAIGNVPLSLHDDKVDFAVWCGYKYLNGGPGCVGGAFVHEQHAGNFALPRLAGWWGHQEEVRFKMEKGFVPMKGADGWQVSNFPVFAGAPLLAALELFDDAGMQKLRKKSELLTGYADFLLRAIDPRENHFRILTPPDADQRGCQLSIFVKDNGKWMYDALTRAGVICDWREPGVIRIAPVPLYNTFEEVYRFGKALDQCIARRALKFS